MNAIKELGELQESFFEKWAQFDKYKDKLSKKQRDRMEEDLFKLYHEEHERLIKKIELENAGNDYDLDVQREYLLPRRCGMFWLKINFIAKLIRREREAQIESDFNKRTTAIERLEAALEEATENATPTGESQAPTQQAENAQDGQEPTATDNKPKGKTKPQKPTDGQEIDKGKPRTQDTAPNTPLIAKK